MLFSSTISRCIADDLSHGERPHPAVSIDGGPCHDRTLVQPACSAEPRTGPYSTAEAARRAVAPSYLSRVLRLTLLAPEIVEAILDGRPPAELQLDDLLVGFPLEWDSQPLGKRHG